MARVSYLFEGVEIAAGESARIEIDLGHGPLGDSRSLAVHVLHGIEEGPTLCLTAAVHGDELNGVTILRHLVYGDDHVAGTHDDNFSTDELHGTLLIVPVVNHDSVILGSRRSPDGRDLNRLFPGNSAGNQSRRLAHALFSRVVKRADMLIDLHAAPLTRTNVPHIRANCDDEVALRMARAFGTPIVLHSDGPVGSLRRTAADHGVDTILLEAGTSHRFENAPIRSGVRGILNVMAEFGMTKHEVHQPNWRLLVRRSRWVRAPDGGLLHSIVRAGDVVREGDLICQITDPLNPRRLEVRAPIDGVVVGLAMTPLLRPGDPIANIVVVRDEKMLDRISKTPLHDERWWAEEGSVVEAEIADHEGVELDTTHVDG